MDNVKKRTGYIPEIFMNGRIALIPEEDYDSAVEAGKEILVFCGGWSGGYARAFGAERVPDYYNINNGNDCFECYSYEIKDKTLTPEDMQKYYRVIVTDGIKVYMKTGNTATDCFGYFCDFDTKYSDYLDRYNPYLDGKKVSEEEFEELRHEVDVEKTIKMIPGNKEEQEKIAKAIKGILH